MDIVLICALLIVGLVLIIKGGDYFVDGASWLAEVSGIPKFIVGATIVSVATTLPEIVVSLISVKASPDMAIGNAVGSVVFNSGVIMALALIAQPFVIKRKDYAFKGILLTAVMALLFGFSLLGLKDSPITTKTEGMFTIVGSIVLIVAFIVFIAENVISAKRSALENAQLKQGDLNENLAEAEEVEEKPVATKKSIIINLVKLIGGAAAVAGGAILLKDNAVELCRVFGVSEVLIGVTVLAIGTSLPELVTMIIAVKKGQASLSIGNIIGANTIDLALILPLCTFIVGGAGVPVSFVHLFVTMPTTLLVIAIGIIPTLISKKFSRWQGGLMMAIYSAYFVFNIVYVLI
ncbi:MAG: calcium/sodium antiporter [Clostridia bacterium]|nr:calcium/sodium antiporter [Clostridia bacterium]